MSIINTFSVSDYEINVKEALRYMGVHRNDDARLLNLTEKLMAEIKNNCHPLVCYTEASVNFEGDLLDFGFERLKSNSLAKNLSGCKTAIIFAATLGIDFDRLLNLKQLTSPTEALVLDALGSAAIEGVCNRFEQIIKKNLNAKLKPRFSPGYGDLDISFQKSITDLLKAKQKIGVALNDSLMLIPTKSVTAIMGVIL